jgi:tRNA(Ile)-lysidine synthase
MAGDGVKIATAHNANDNAETVLFNIARGATIKGGGGIPPVRDAIIRPLIYCTRKEIEGYCEENALEYVTDSTNLSDDYTRNKIRHMVLPVLEEINSESISNFTFFSSNAREVSEYIKGEALRALDYARDFGSNYFVGALLDFDDVVVREALVILFHDMTNKTLERKKLDELMALLNGSGRIQVYGDIFAEVIRGKFRFFVKDKQSAPEAIYVDNLPFEAVFGDYLIKTEAITESSEKFNKKVLDNLIDCDKIVGKVFLRTRVVGDKISLPNRGVTKSLKKLFNEMNIPVEKRDFIPVLCDDVGVVWVYSVGVDARCHVDANSSNIIFIGGKNND